MHGEDSRPVPRDKVLFDIEMALRKGEKLWPKHYRPGDHACPGHRSGDRFKPLAGAILAHLELCGLRFFRKPSRPWHSTPGPWAGAGAGEESG